MPSSKLLLRSSIAILLCVQPFVTSADENSVLDEIIVTADFRSRAVDSMPAAITVLDSQQIGERAVQHFEELISSMPNLNWSGDGNRARYLQIRGIGELEQYQGAPNPSVGLLIDDIDFSGIGSVATLFDMQQIEVLRGPQGSRYGANALAGLIYMQSTVPTPDWSGIAQLSAGSDTTRALGLAAGGALNASRSLLLRASLQRFQSDGFRHNPYLGRDDTNGRDESVLRTRLRWLANEAWQLDLALMHADIDDGYDAFAIDNSYTVLSDKPGRDAQRSSGASLKAVYTGWHDLTLTSISAIANSAIAFGYDADWGNVESWAPIEYDYVSSNKRERRTITQEVRVVGPQWLAGIYANRLCENLRSADRGTYYDPFYDYADSLDTSLRSSYTATTGAVFGQYDVASGDATTVSVGVRAERRSSNYSDSNDLRESPMETMYGGELSLRHEHSTALTSFVVLSRGFKAGGFNLGLVPDDRREFDAESIWNLEAGIKSRLRQNSLQLDASVFLARRQQQQTRTSFQIDPGDPTSFVFFTDNAARGDTLGLEAELHWQPLPAWDLYASLGLLDARFDRFVTPQVDLSGRRQAHAPAYSVAIGGRYTHTSGMFARFDLTAHDRFYFDVSHNEMSHAYALANVRFGIEKDRWSLQFWVRNLFDKDYAVRGFYFGNEPPDFLPALYTRWGDPRQIGFNADIRF